MRETLTQLVSFRVSAREKQLIEQLAARDDRKLADVIRRTFRKGLALEGTLRPKKGTPT